MKRAWVVLAAAVVLVSHAWVQIAVSRNRGEAAGGTVELTERELRLRPVGGESTALFLELEWDALSAEPEPRGPPRWLDAAKLADLGFDCQLPVTDPDARAYYGAQPARLVYLVFEYAGEAWKQARPDRKTSSRLFAVDAGLDPVPLRSTYPDASRYILCRGTVRISLRREEALEGKPPPFPRLEGWLQPVPDWIFVPRPYNRALEGLHGRDEAGESAPAGEPRFAASVSWGRRYEPWITGVRRLLGDQPPALRTP
jgi:hypothetical protein